MNSIAIYYKESDSAVICTQCGHNLFYTQIVSTMDKVGTQNYEAEEQQEKIICAKCGNVVAILPVDGRNHIVSKRRT